MPASGQPASFSASNTRYPILARPFFNVPDGLEDSRLIAYPNVVSGTVMVDATTELVNTAKRVGAEVMSGLRENTDGKDGDAQRIQFMAMYSF